MAKYRLTAQHYINGALLEEGTEIGEGTEVPFSGRPSVQMIGIDAEGQKAVEARQKSWVDPINTLNVKADDRKAEDRK